MGTVSHVSVSLGAQAGTRVILRADERFRQRVDQLHRILEVALTACGCESHIISEVRAWLGRDGGGPAQSSGGVELCEVVYRRYIAEGP